MIKANNDLASKSLQLKKDDNNFSRTISKDQCNNNNPSFRIYYGGISGAVPFTWESQPGTPKHHTYSITSLIPPLTPPPSYQTKLSNKAPVKKVHLARSSSLLQSFFFKSFNKQNNVAPSSPSSLTSSWSSSSSSNGSTMILRKRRSRPSRASFDSMMDAYYYEEEAKSDTPRHSSSTAITCFGFGSSEGNRRGGELRRSCTYSATSMKKALLNIIVGQGSKSRY